MSNPSHRGPRALSDILGELFTVRGYARIRARQELEAAWNKAVGEPYWRETRLDEVRRGVLNVTVAHSMLLEELSAFRKSSLLRALRLDAPATIVHDIRFRVGPVVEPGEGRVSSSGLAVDQSLVNHRTRQSRRTSRKSQGKPGQASGADPMES